MSHFQVTIFMRDKLPQIHTVQHIDESWHLLSLIPSHDKYGAVVIVQDHTGKVVHTIHVRD